MPSTIQSTSLLICEDDAKTRASLCERLRLDGYEPVPAARFGQALSLISTTPLDLIIVDISLPDGSGLEIIRRVRVGDPSGPSQNTGVPIIVVSGFGAEEDRIRGLREGADDYVSKPFSYGELLARIEALLRRNRQEARSLLEIGDLVVDRGRHIATVSGRRCDLSPKEFDLLTVMAAEPTRVFTKRELLLRVWGYDAVGRTRTLDAHASRLRRKLDRDAGTYIHNVWGVGYCLMES